MLGYFKRKKEEAALTKLFNERAKLAEQSSTFGWTPHDRRLVEMKEDAIKQTLWDARPKADRKALEKDGFGSQNEKIPDATKGIPDVKALLESRRKPKSPRR